MGGNELTTRVADSGGRRLAQIVRAARRQGLVKHAKAMPVFAWEVPATILRHSAYGSPQRHVGWKASATGAKTGF
jgi:hypothetical protein